MTTASANSRLEKRFQSWDANGNGALERADFEQEAERIVRAFGKQPGSPEAQRVRKALIGIFDYHAKQAGVGPNDSIPKQKFLEIDEKLISEQSGATFNRVVRPLVEAVVGLCDQDRNGTIDRDEFAAYLGAIGADPEKARADFDAIDTNGNGQLTVDEMLEAIRNFHYGKLEIDLLG